MAKEKPVDGWEGAKDVNSNWWKAEKVGDKIKGTLLKKTYQKSSNPLFADQWIYELRTEDGQVFNVGVSIKKKGTVDRLNNCKLGEIIGVLYECDLEPSQKGFHPTKQLKVVTWGMDPSYHLFDSGEEVSGEELPPM